MLREPLPLEATRQVTPRALTGYAKGLGWQPVPNGMRPEITVYHRPDSRLHQVIIPPDPTLDDYDEAVAEAIRKLADYERRPASEVLEHLLVPPSDVLDFGEVSPDAEAGSLPFDHSVRLINGMRRLLLSAAHSVLVPQAYHPRLSRTEAEEFVNRCRLGQTKRGSFVLSVACPLDVQLTVAGAEPFTRQVTTLLVDTLEALTRAADMGMTDHLLDPARHRGMSANLCEALLTMRPHGDRSTLSVSAAWSRTLLPPSRQTERQVSLHQDAFGVAEALASRLRTVPRPMASRFYGYIDALLGQPSQTDPRPSGEVRFLLFDQEEEISARALLNADDYTEAGLAHLAGDVVRFRGVLHHLPRLNRIEQVTDFERLEFEIHEAPNESASQQTSS